MTETADEATAPQASGLQALAREIRTAVGADTVFGTPIRHDGVTVVPVAKAGFGLGGGYRKTRQRGGASGGGAVRPVGFIVIDGVGARFRPIWGGGQARAALVGLVIGLWLGKRRRRR